MAQKPFDAAEFWDRVDIAGDGDCWKWLRATDKDGYGWVSVYGINHRANRIALAMQSCVCPDGAKACHTCHNPSCCNPRHLYWGTHAENMRDRKLAGKYDQPRNDLGRFVEVA